MIETNRIFTSPFIFYQMVKCSQSDNSLEKEMNLNEVYFSPELKEAPEGTTLLNILENTKNYLCPTLCCGRQFQILK